MQDKATKGAHIRIYGDQKARICNVDLSRLPFQLVFHGGTNVFLENVLTCGVWDAENVANQEGVTQIAAFYDSVHGLPTNWDMQRCYMAGQASNERTLSWVTGDNGTVSRTYSRSIGSRRGFHCTGMENGKFHFNHCGGLAEQEVLFPQVTGSAMLDIEWAHNFMDGSSHGVGLLVSPAAAGLCGLDFKMFGNTFIDQSKGIVIDPAPGSTPSVYGLQVHDNVCRNMIGTPIVLRGAKGFDVHGNALSSSNRFNPSRVDVLLAVGIAVLDASEDGEIYANKIGGGVRFGPAPPAAHTNYPETTAPYNADPNFCWTDAYVAPGLTDVFYYDNRRSKCMTKIAQAAPAGLR